MVGYFFHTMKQCLSFSLAFSKFPTLSQDIPHAAHTLVVSRLHLVEISIARLNRLSHSNWSLIRLRDTIYSNKANIQFAMSGYVHKVVRVPGADHTLITMHYRTLITLKNPVGLVLVLKEFFCNWKTQTCLVSPLD